MRFPFFRNRDSVKNGILISIRRTGDGFHPGLFIVHIMSLYKNTIYLRNSKNLKISRTYTEEVKKRIHTYWKEHTTNGRDIHT